MQDMHQVCKICIKYVRYTREIIERQRDNIEIKKKDREITREREIIERQRENIERNNKEEQQRE